MRRKVQRGGKEENTDAGKTRQWPQVLELVQAGIRSSSRSRQKAVAAGLKNPGTSQKHKQEADWRRTRQDPVERQKGRADAPKSKKLETREEEGKQLQKVGHKISSRHKK